MGFNELNSWGEYESASELVKNKPRMVFNAAAAGFTYSHLMTSTAQPYHIGLIAALPFAVLGEYKEPHFQRGVLHVYFSQMKLHVFIVHLHAKSSVQRAKEAMKLSEIIAPLLADKQKVIIMGDFNTLSPFDQR